MEAIVIKFDGELYAPAKVPKDVSCISCCHLRGTDLCENYDTFCSEVQKRLGIGNIAWEIINEL